MPVTRILYFASFFVGYAIALLLNQRTAHLYRCSSLRVGLYSLTFFYGFAGAAVAGRVYSAIYHSLGYVNESYLAMFGAVMLVPLLEIATVLIEKAVRGAVNRRRAQTQAKPPLPPVSVRDTLDMLTPNIFIVLACGKVGCHINGCCYGVECAWGLHRTFAGKEFTLFPVQLTEAALIAAVLVLAFFLKRRPFYRRGMAYPLTAALYSVVRFGMESLRWYEPEMRRLVLGMTLWQFCCVIVFVSSVISLIILYKTGGSAPLQKPRKTK